jgi:metallo-beta-lactamase family protein
MDGLSGHADRQGLLDWISGFTEKPKQVFVVHGDEDSADSFTKLLSEEKGYTAMAPYSGTVYDLAAGTFVKVTEGVRIEKQTPDEDGVVQAPQRTGSHTVSDSYTNLRMAQRELTNVIAGSAGMTNKDLDAFSKALRELTEKYRIDPQQTETGKTAGSR